MNDTSILIRGAACADGAPCPSTSPWALVTEAEKQYWPPEPWDLANAGGVVHYYALMAVPGAIFSSWVLVGYGSLLANRTDYTFSIDPYRIRGLTCDPVLANAVCVVQDVAYRQSGSMSLAIMASVRFACLELLRRGEELGRPFLRDGEIYAGDMPHWSHLAAAAQVELFIPVEAPFFDANQHSFKALMCALFNNPWNCISKETKH